MSRRIIVKLLETRDKEKNLKIVWRVVRRVLTGEQ